MKIYCVPIVMALLAVLAGCAVSTSKTITVTQPISTVESAVKSALDDDEPQQAVDVNGLPLYIAIVPFANETAEENAPVVMRRTLQNHLSTKNYSVMHWREVDLKVAELNADILDDNAKLSDALGVPGLVRGTITSYDFFYAGIYAHIKLGVDLRLENSAGEILWQDQLEVTTRAGGVSTSPWGLLLNAALAAMHLNEKNLLAAADQLGREVAVLFPEPSGYQGVVGPVVEDVLHDGVGRTLRYGDTLTIGLKGESGQRAIGSIEGIGSFDMREIEPGVYMVEQPISAEWNISKSEVSGRLINAAGQSTRWTSPVGLLSIDNQAPAPVESLTLQAHSDKAFLSWQAPADLDLANYRVYQLHGEQRSIVSETDATAISLPQPHAFADLRYEVTALDRVANESEGRVASARAYPMPGAVTATQATSRLGGVVSGGLIINAANSPYTLTEELLITEDGELYVEPGVLIRVSPSGRVRIEGEAWFWGEQATIRFEPQQQSQAGAEYLVLDTKSTVNLQGVEFDGAGIAVTVLSGSPQFQEVKFLNSMYSAMSITGTSSPRLTACVVEGSNTSGVVIEDHAKPVFSGCRFSANEPFHIQSTSIYQVTAKDNEWHPAASSASVLGKVSY
ncbi:MAG: right-handed parallel beta-helix repeat-containing protein [Halioglobus sp.]